MSIPQIEPYELSSWAKRKGLTHCFIYHGLSMTPTFQPGQVLYVRPMAVMLLSGDVVVYKSGEKLIVHRIKAIQGEGIITRGDNNLDEDPYLVRPEQIIGVVESAGDWDRQRPVTGGRSGLYLALLRWSLLEVYTNSLPWLGAPYRWLKAQRWVGRIWHPRVTTVQLQSQDGLLIKYVVHGKTMATWQPELKYFICRRPYDLIIFPPE